MGDDSIFIYSTRADCEMLLRYVEAQIQLRYTLCGLFSKPELLTYNSGLDIRHLGVASSGDDVHEDRYLVVDSTIDVKIREVQRGRFDEPLFAVDQLVNPRSIIFQPGGIYEEEYLIRGSLGTVSRHPSSVTLYRSFLIGVKSLFVQVKHNWLGPEACILLKDGVCLTESSRLPRQYCLTEEL